MRAVLAWNGFRLRDQSAVVIKLIIGELMSLNFDLCKILNTVKIKVISKNSMKGEFFTRNPQLKSTTAIA